MNTHAELQNSAIIPWAIARENVTGLAELGPRVNREPTNESADMDLLVLADEVEPLLDADQGITSIGPIG